MIQKSPISRNPLTSQSPEARAWRARQAEASADIEGLADDAESAALMDQMERDGIPDEEQAARMIAHFQMRERTSPPDE
tara:strand:- start:5717 stop:5953 length:237 start_codon:yes stop_codon:yes gene_type:complete